MLRETRGNVTKMINIFLKLINLIYLFLEMNLKSLYIYIYIHTHIYIYIYISLNHLAVYLKLTQHCQSTIFLLIKKVCCKAFKNVQHGWGKI